MLVNCKNIKTMNMMTINGLGHGSRKCIRIAVAVLVAVLSCHTAMAQKERGDMYILPRVGMNSSWLKGNDILTAAGENGEKVSSSAKIGLTAGCEVEYMFHKSFGLRSGLLYSVQGDKLKTGVDAVGDRKTTLGYLCVPLMATLYATDHLGISAGVQYSHLVHSKVTDGGGSDSADWLRKNDFSIPIGVSLEYGRVVADVRYQFGLIQTHDFFKTGKNRSVWVTLGYRISM